MNAAPSILGKLYVNPGPQGITYCHTVGMYDALTVSKTPEAFYSDYYLAIVTILPILMIATEVLYNFAHSVSLEAQHNWSPPFYLLVSFFYLFSPLIAAIGIATGILALMFQETNAAYQWITFACLISVLGFLAIASVVYLAYSDPGKNAQDIFKRRRTGRSESTPQSAEAPASSENAGGSSEFAPRPHKDSAPDGGGTAS